MADLSVLFRQLTAADRPEDEYVLLLTVSVCFREAYYSCSVEMFSLTVYFVAGDLS